jgi:predicted transcriptional regulator
MSQAIDREKEANLFNQDLKVRNKKVYQEDFLSIRGKEHPSSQKKGRKIKLTQEKVVAIKKLRKQGLPNEQICKQLGISYPTLAKWIKRLALPKKYEGQRERNLRRIHSAIERLGCCTIKELSEETTIPSYTTDKYLNYLLRRGEIGKITIRRGRKSKLTHRGTELFGETSGLVLFYLDKREAISRLLNTITKSQDKGIKCSLTHYLKNFGFAKAEIEEINRKRIIQENIVNLQLKIRDIEHLSEKKLIPRSLMNLFTLPNIQMALL